VRRRGGVARQDAAGTVLVRLHMPSAPFVTPNGGPHPAGRHYEPRIQPSISPAPMDARARTVRLRIRSGDGDIDRRIYVLPSSA
jgi:hypothetical protein